MEKEIHHSFEVKDCALAAIATGKQAENLKELRDIVTTIQPSSLYYHFWGGLLRPRFDDPEYNNDFAAWARHTLHDGILAERLGVIDPVAFPDLEALRREIIEIVEERLDETGKRPWFGLDEPFHFITSQIVVFGTNRIIRRPEELVGAVPSMTISSVFYHFIDARRRTFGHMDDFQAWLYGFGDRHVDLCHILSTLDPFFSTLSELRLQLATLFKEYFEG